MCILSFKQIDVSSDESQEVVTQFINERLDLSIIVATSFEAGDNFFAKEGTVYIPVYIINL